MPNDGSVSKCPSGKRRFLTRRLAKAFVRARNDQQGNHVYRCPACGDFHTTSVNAATRQWHREHRTRKGNP